MVSLRAAALAAVNMTSSVLIVLCNKVLFKSYDFNYPLTLTLVHFLFTIAGVVACRRVGLVDPVSISVTAILPLSCAYAGFVVLTNISLQLNSVGLYQILKICTTPTIVLIEFFGYSKRAPLDRLAALALICVGAAAVTVTDVDVSPLGLMVGIAGVLVTSFYQVWVGTVQRALKINTLQLMLKQMPLSAALLLPVIVLAEDVTSGSQPLVSVVFTPQLLGVIVVTAVMAFFVNVSTFYIIAELSAISYNVLGHCKTCVIIVGGALMFRETFDLQKASGVCCCIVGAFCYARLNQKQAAAPAAVSLDDANASDARGKGL